MELGDSCPGWSGLGPSGGGGPQSAPSPCGGSAVVGLLWRHFSLGCPWWCAVATPLVIWVGGGSHRFGLRIPGRCERVRAGFSTNKMSCSDYFRASTRLMLKEKDMLAREAVKHCGDEFCEAMSKKLFSRQQSELMLLPSGCCC